MDEKEAALKGLMAALGKCELFGMKVWLTPFHGGDRLTKKAAIILEGVEVKEGRLVAMKAMGTSTSMADDKNNEV